MKQTELSDYDQAATVLRTCAGLSALAAVLGWMGLLSSSSGAQLIFPYQIFGVMLSIAMLVLTFEPHFPYYWHFAAALFFSASLVIWTGLGLAINSLIPIVVLIMVIPIVTVLLPWDWQFQLAICSLCVGAGLLALWKPPAPPHLAHLWMIAAGESAVAVLASLQLERQRKQQFDYVQALAADEEQFRALIENSPDGLTVLDRVGTVVFKSPSARRLLGYDDDMIGHSCYEFVHQEDAPTMRALLADCLCDRDRTFSITMRCRHGDGSWRVIEGTGKQLANHGSEPVVVLNWRDVSERVTQERRIRESEERFRKIFQYSTDAISIASRVDGRYLDVNDEWLRVLGFTREEVIGKDPLMLGIWVDAFDFALFASEFLTNEEVRNRPTKFRAKDGSIVRGSLSAVMLETGGREVALGVVNVLSIEKPSAQSN